MVERKQLNKGNYEGIKGRLKSLTRKWWFLLLFILFQFFPAYASKGYDPSKWDEFIGLTLEHAFVSSVDWLYPIFKLVPMILVVSIIFLGNRAPESTWQF